MRSTPDPMQSRPFLAHRRHRQSVHLADGITRASIARITAGAENAGLENDESGSYSKAVKQQDRAKIRRIPAPFSRSCRFASPASGFSLSGPAYSIAAHYDPVRVVVYLSREDHP